MTVPLQVFPCETNETDEVDEANKAEEADKSNKTIQEVTTPTRDHQGYYTPNDPYFLDH